MSSVILTSHMYGTNAVQDDRGGGYGRGFKLDQERYHEEPPAVASPGLVSDHKVLS